MVRKTAAISPHDQRALPKTQVDASLQGSFKACYND